MSEFLLIAPSDWIKVDNDMLSLSASQYEQGVDMTEVTDTFREAGIITAEQEVDQLKYIAENNELYMKLV